jgi:hypothetical protein
MYNKGSGRTEACGARRILSFRGGVWKVPEAVDMAHRPPSLHPMWSSRV